jgi:hypothetical protein|tara:strand:- start:544 stop:918 length:375 start_codon:yes stop_codon:yes gene_type:complete
MKIGNQGEGGGKPLVVFDQEQTELVEKLAAVLTKSQLSDYMGISENTFRAVELRQSEVFEGYKRGKAKAIAAVAGNLVNQATQGNVSASMFFLKTQAGWREQEPEVASFNDDNVIQIIRAVKSD